MSKIKGAIPRQYFEIIRDRIYDILIDEFENQFILTYDPELDFTGYLERNTPFDKTELSSFIVSLASGNYSNKNQGNVDGEYTFNIDFYTSAKTKIGFYGDTGAAIKLQKLLGIARAILENPAYKTLGFTPPFIMKSYIDSINIAAGNKEDATNTSMGRLSFIVKANENTELIEPTLIDGYETTIKVNESSKGYFIKRENYG